MEIGPDGRDVRDLRSRLDLDSGYLSRLLRSLENDGLVTVGVNQADSRLRTARLTAAGQAERAELDRLSDAAAAAPRSAHRADSAADSSPRWPWWSGCWPPRRSRSACAIRGTPTRGTACGPTSRSCPAASTAASTRPRSISAADHEMTAPAGLFLVATLHAEPVGCGALKLRPARPRRSSGCGSPPESPRLGLGAGCWPNWRPAPPLTVCASCGWRPTGPSARRSACTGRPGPRGGGVQRRALRAPLVREGTTFFRLRMRRRGRRPSRPGPSERSMAAAGNGAWSCSR